MGCTTSKSDIQLGSIKAWDYKVDGKAKSVSEEELQTLRKKFWESRTGGKAEIWNVLHECCDLVLNSDIDAANDSLRLHGLTVISGDLCVVKDKDGFVYNIERYCFSTPRNVELKLTLPTSETQNHRFRFRIGAPFLDEEREIVFVFEKKGQHEADITPKEHSPENHCYYNTYHFTDDLTTITEAQVHQKLVDTIQNVES
ncbi:uncharacterized protein [Blastocystis hominis]|uniref:DC-UbP/UBTD2 N-terminal domain-containing protein n=1 Tax=Blastocystis hominis TaxID=12968 RepID=D8M7J4_BLAHO|nr:uncharacterized protein [Blastocystis hominis]CBK24033.2 unnamed protein product [Blastocystis hominis]|eukprot:XP_012898081.1 uncharacterized protein [Blastocystis hominis]